METKLFANNFKNKKVTKMGFGPNGRSYGDIKFLLSHGAEVLVTDYRDADDLYTSKDQLMAELSPAEQENLTFVFGEHREVDFTSCDYVLKASGVPLDSEYILAATDAGVPVYSSSAWLFSIVSDVLDVITVGVTGTKGKSTTTDMIEHVLKGNNKRYHVAGNIRGVANLPVLDEIKEGDILLAELDSWQLQGFGDMHISPNISVFTNFFEDHLNYYNGSMDLYFTDKSYIYKYQNDLDICFASKQAWEQIHSFEKDVPDTIEDISAAVLPDDLELKVLGEHNRMNAALAYAVVQQLGLTREEIVSHLASYKAMDGRLRFIGQKDEIAYYDDNNSTTPTSTNKSLTAIKKQHPGARILWFGGGADKEFNYGELAQALPNLVDAGVLFAGAATDKILDLVDNDFSKNLIVVDSMATAWEHIDEIKQKGDVVVLSPGAASFGVFLNEYQRGDQYNNHVQKLLN